MHQEMYSLSWKSYSDHLSDMMKELIKNNDFADITLVTDDKKHMKAHKNILSACSPAFRYLMSFDKKSNSIFYLRGIQFSELESIMQFIYFGEATLHKERMNEFLSAAESLEIKGLSNTDAEIEEFNDTSHLIYKNENSSNESFTEELGEDQNMETSFPDIEHSSKNTLKRNESKKFKCNKCDKEYGYSSHLQEHIRAKHEGVRYSCEKCVYQATTQSSLKLHIKATHEGVRYACDQCDYQASQQGILRAHIESKHEGVKYACDQCDYKATTKSSLKIHIEAKHEGVRYACDLCEYQATQQTRLKQHIKSKHELLSTAESFETKGLRNEDAQINESNDISRLIHPSEHSSEESFIEEVCEDKNIKTNLPDNEHSSKKTFKRYQIGKFRCDQCDKVYGKQTHLQQHIEAKHIGVMYSCEKCEYQSVWKSTLKTHIEAIHEGVRYVCDQCDYQASQHESLKKHIKSKHDGVKYPCDQCDYQATTQESLKMHTTSKHIGIKFACDQCDQQFTQKGNLRRHIQSKHQHHPKMTQSI